MQEKYLQQQLINLNILIMNLKKEWLKRRGDDDEDDDDDGVPEVPAGGGK